MTTFDLGYKIKYLRKAKQMTQTDLANILGVTKSAVSSYENNSKQPSFETLVRFVQHFGLSMDYMFGLASDSNIASRKYLDITGLTANQCILLNDMVEGFRKVNTVSDGK